MKIEISDFIDGNECRYYLDFSMCKRSYVMYKIRRKIIRKAIKELQNVLE